MRKRLMRRVVGWRRDESGAAAVEFAFLAMILCTILLNVIDLATYLFARVQVENAAEMSAQAIWHACDLDHVPATSKCPSWQSAATAAARSTSLGSSITLASGMPAEGYYCVNSANALQYVSDTSTRPNDCTAAGVPANKPGDYVRVDVVYTYTPMFGEFTVGGLLAGAITATAMMRLS